MTMNTAAARPRDASTVAIVRDGPSGLETLLLQRAERGDHNSGAWVFPGGLLDPADGEVPCVGLDDAQASRQLGVAQGGLAHYVAAARECFEEAGLLFAVTRDGQPLDLASDAGQRLLAQREPLQAGSVRLSQLCEDFDLRLTPGELHYIAHWLTPVGRAKRFDTRFFVAVQPSGQASAHDRSETLDHVWMRPREALAPQNTRRLMTPTRAVLQTLAGFASTGELLQWARTPRTVQRVLPRLGTDATGMRPVLPHEEAWEELGLLDPQGTGTAWCEPRRQQPVRLTPHLLRVTADNGQNTYVVGGDECAVVGPCSDDATHLDTLLAAAPGPVRWVVQLTGGPEEAHAVAQLHERTNAQVIDARVTPEPLQGLGFALQFVSQGGVRVAPDSILICTEPPVHADESIAWIAPRRGFLRAGQRQGETT